MALAATNAWLVPFFHEFIAQSWRAVMGLWAAIATLIGVVWFVLASIWLKPMDSAASTTPQFTVMRQLLRSRPVQIVLLMSVGVFLFNHGLNNWLVELLRVHGMTSEQAGYWATIPTIVGIVGSLVIPRLATPERRFKILLTLCVLAALSSVLLQFGE